MPFADCRAAADVLAVTSTGDQIGKQCADSCVRGCCGGPAAPVSAPTTFVPPCPDAGGYRAFGWHGTHLGYDYNASAGTPVRAIADGIVVDVKLNVGGFGGNDPTTGKSKPGPLVWIRYRTSTGEFFHVLYGHIKPSKSKNQRVIAGDVVGTIISLYDDKGNYIPHLHLGIWQGKNSLPTQQLGYGPTRNFVDPIAFMKSHQPGLLRR